MNFREADLASGAHLGTIQKDPHLQGYLRKYQHLDLDFILEAHSPKMEEKGKQSLHSGVCVRTTSDLGEEYKQGAETKSQGPRIDEDLIYPNDY